MGRRSLRLQPHLGWTSVPGRELRQLWLCQVTLAAAVTTVWYDFPGVFTQTVSFKQETHGTIAGHAAAVATTLCHMPLTLHLSRNVCLLTPSSLPCRRLAGQGEDLPWPADRSFICHRMIQITETWHTRLQKLGKYNFTPSTLRSELLEDSYKTVLWCCQEGWKWGGERRGYLLVPVALSN